MNYKVEKGKQIGIEKRILKNDKYYWYLYAIQKVNNIYISYELEIAEDTMFADIDDYDLEIIKKYNSLEDLEKDFVSKYDITLDDLNTLKGQRIFNASSYL